jgi:hypothetical protein
MNKTITIFFGEIGSGKSYYASKYSNFLEGDNYLSPEVLERVSKFKPLTKEMVSESIKKFLIPAIIDKARLSNANLFISQALYSNQDRLFIKSFLELIGYKVGFIWVKPSIWKNFTNLLKRKSFKWFIYWLINKPYFDPPTHKHLVFR